MSGASNWPPRSFLAPLATLYVVEILGEEATHARIEKETQRNYPTVHRHLKILRECLGVDINCNNHGVNYQGDRYYVVKDWGILDRDSFMELFEQHWAPLILNKDTEESED